MTTWTPGAIGGAGAGALDVLAVLEDFEVRDLSTTLVRFLLVLANCLGLPLLFGPLSLQLQYNKFCTTLDEFARQEFRPRLARLAPWAYSISTM